MFLINCFKMAANTSGFRAKVFDPLLIISQIIALQCFFYVSLGMCVVFSDTIAASHPSFDQLFNYKVSSILCFTKVFISLCVRSLKDTLVVGL